MFYIFLQNSLRICKLIFFCSNILCTCDPPVLKLIENNNNDDDSNKYSSQYISVVQNRTDEVCYHKSSYLIPPT